MKKAEEYVLDRFAFPEDLYSDRQIVIEPHTIIEMINQARKDALDEAAKRVRTKKDTAIPSIVDGTSFLITIDKDSILKLKDECI